MINYKWEIVMNIRHVVLGMLLLIPSLVFAVITPAQVLPITSYENEDVTMVLIHPTEIVMYEFLDQDTVNKIKLLQESYDLVFITLRANPTNIVSIYDMKKSAVLKIGDQTTNCADFYDVFKYTWSGIERLSGFFMFPKVIDSASTQRVTIECEVNRTRHSFDINFEKLRNLINILSDN